MTLPPPREAGDPPGPQPNSTDCALPERDVAQSGGTVLQQSSRQFDSVSAVIPTPSPEDTDDSRVPDIWNTEVMPLLIEFVAGCGEGLDTELTGFDLNRTNTSVPALKDWLDKVTQVADVSGNLWTLIAERESIPQWTYKAKDEDTGEKRDVFMSWRATVCRFLLASLPIPVILDASCALGHPLHVARQDDDVWTLYKQGLEENPTITSGRRAEYGTFSLKVASKSLFQGVEYEKCRRLQDHYHVVSVTLSDILTRALDEALASAETREKYAQDVFGFANPKATNAGRIVSGKARKASGAFVDLLQTIRSEEDKHGSLRYPVPEFNAVNGGSVVENFENNAIKSFKENWLVMSNRHFCSRMRQVFFRN